MIDKMLGKGVTAMIALCQKIRRKLLKCFDPSIQFEEDVLH